jgi:hypothetical protein
MNFNFLGLSQSSAAKRALLDIKIRSIVWPDRPDYASNYRSLS